jgi:zinc protease
VKDYYKSVFRPDMTTIVVIGNISPEVAVSTVEKYFGDWSATGDKPNTLFPAVPDNAVSAVHVPDSSRVQVKVALAQTLSITRTNPDYYALQLGNHILGSGFYATRFYRDLRENAGLVYYVGSQFNIGLTRGVYQVPYDCDPPNVSKARSMIVRDLKQMQTDKVTDHELHQAKLMLMRDIPLGESSTGDIANSWLSLSGLGLPLDEPVMAGQIYLKLTAKDVQAAYAKWLRPDDLVQVTQGPEPK